MTAKDQRLVLVLLGVGAVAAAALLALSGLRDQAAFFYSPSDLARDHVPAGQPVRLGGMVAAHSVERLGDGVTTRFVVVDNGPERLPVRFRGILPDLFREGSGVVAEGALAADGVFVATNILAKHDERYMPPPMVNTAAGAMHETRTLKR